MDGAALPATVRDALGETKPIPKLPFLLTAAADGDLARLAEIRASHWGTHDPTFSDGMNLSVHGRDYYSVTDRDVMAAALADETGGVVKAFDFTGYRETCAQWAAGTAPSSTRKAVTSDVPTLLIAGSFDPLTPPLWAQLAAQGLTNSTDIEFASYGHNLGLVPMPQPRTSSATPPRLQTSHAIHRIWLLRQ